MKLNPITTHTEFSVGVEVEVLEELSYQPCSELQAICQLLDAPQLTCSPAELFPSDEPIVTVSIRDPTCFLRIDIRGPRDQEDIVSIHVRCHNDVASAVDELLRQIRSKSAVNTALLRGNLGLPPVTRRI